MTIRSLEIEFAGMRIVGTVESPDDAPVRYFHRHNIDGDRQILALKTHEPYAGLGSLFGDPEWAEVVAPFLVVERV